MTVKSPQLAADWDPKKLKFPVVAQPKFDGVRGCNLHGRLTGRSLRLFGNRHIGIFFSQNCFHGFDGELAAEAYDNPLLCSLTTSATGTHEGEPWLMWHTFDLLLPDTVDRPYIERYDWMQERVAKIQRDFPHIGNHLSVMPNEWARNMDELEAIIERHAEANLEGTIIRNPYLPHKNGRSSPTHGGLLRAKTFIEVDARVDELIEGCTNQNEAKLNPLGRTERSTHKENMLPSGKVGSILATLLEDAKHPITSVVIFPKGTQVKFGAGSMPHFERELYMREPHRIRGKRMRGQIFPHGVKDKSRFPTYKCLRSDADTVDM